MTKNKDPRILLSIPVVTARFLYTILEHASVVEDALVESGVVVRFTKSQKKQLVELYDDLAFKLSMELYN